MKKIVVGITNGLLAEAITVMLRNHGEFQPYRVKSGTHSAVTRECILVHADVVLLEVTRVEGSSVSTGIQETQKVRNKLPNCKVVFLCDENSTPDIARDIQNAKKNGYIDGFFFTSVSTSYLLAALDAL